MIKFDIGMEVICDGVELPCIIMENKYDGFMVSDGDHEYTMQYNNMKKWESYIGAEVSVSNELCGYVDTSIKFNITQVCRTHSVIVNNGTESHHCGKSWITPWNLRRLRQGKKN